MTTDTADLRRRLDALADTDPRLDGAYVRLVDDTPNPAVLLGVVHDHPASVARVRAVVDTVDPDVVAVEAPDVLTPAFTEIDGAGGEMTAAADAAAADAEVVGVDAPGRGTLRSLASVVADEQPDAGTVASALADLGRLGAHAVRGRLQAAGVPEQWLGGAFERTQSYDCPPDASPAEQASHEASRVSRSTSLLRAFDPPPATRVLDAVRERQMGRRLAALAGGDDDSVLVGVVGFSHLDAVENELASD